MCVEPPPSLVTAETSLCLDVGSEEELFLAIEEGSSFEGRFHSSIYS